MKPILKIFLLIVPLIMGTSGIFAQKTLTGRVNDAQGQPVIGANVVIKGTTTGVTTDVEGKFTLNPPSSGASLIISFIGYITKEVAVDNLSVIDITLESDAMSLDEVVVVGYGTQKKVNLTGSLSTVNTKQLEARPVSNVSSALQGTMAGVTVTVDNGQPGRDEGAIRIRGIGTLSNSDAMVMVDGVVSSLNDINPSDIESVTVLKDAASAAIYGSRASNGVILITTKKGNSGGVVAHYNMYMGKQSPSFLPDYLPSWQASSLYNEALVNEGKSPAYTDAEIQKFKDGSDPDNYPNTDWLGLLYKGSGFQQNHFFDVSGGNEKTQSYLSIGYFSQDGIIKGSGLDRYTTRFKVNTTLGKRISLYASLAYSLDNFKEPASTLYGNDLSTIIWQTNRIGSTVPYKPNGYYGYNDDGSPMAALESGSFNKNKEQHVAGILGGDLKIIEGLHFKPMFGYDLRLDAGKKFVKNIQYYDWQTGDPTYVQGPNKVYDSNYNNTAMTFQALLQYDKSIGRHDLTVLGGFSQDYTQDRYLSGYRFGFLNNALSEIDAGPVTGQETSGSASEYALQSLFGRINYSFNKRYLLEGNLRYDGSSRFAEGNRWSLFPSVSAGWRISEEGFFESLKYIISDFKIRGSWGKLGNQNIVSYYPYQSTVSMGQDYTFGGEVSSGLAPTQGVNQDIRWEDTETSDFGFDAVLLKGMITITSDYFIRNTSNILLKIPVGAAYGLTPPVINAGSVQNKGFELTVGYHHITTDFTFDFSANATFIDNTITDLAGTDPIINGYTFMKVGYPINSFYGYQAEGLFQTPQQVADHATQYGGVIEPGDIKYKDIVVDGEINGSDRQYLGTYFPKTTYGINLAAGWKGFDFSVFFQGAAGVKGFLQAEIFGQLRDRSGKPTSIFMDRWTPENTDASFPRVWNSYTQNDPGSMPSSFWVRSADYIRMKNIQFGYTLPEKLTLKAGVKHARIYYSGKDLLTFTKFYKWVDPEAPAGDSGWNHPMVKTNSFGVSLTF
jgi:TonB-linked SusC/RagA family outer membrane protein